MRYLDFHANHESFPCGRVARSPSTRLWPLPLWNKMLPTVLGRSGHVGGLRSSVQAVPRGVVDPAFSVHQLSAAFARVSRET